MNAHSVSFRSLSKIVLLLLIADTCRAQAPATAPDMVLINGRVFTGTPERPYVEAIAIKGVRIIAVGASQEISSLAGPATRRIDLTGHLVIPGINGSHLHFQEDPIG